MRIKTSRPHDHTFPSGAVMAIPDGWEGTVKREVGEGAVAAGAAKEVRAPRTSKPASSSAAKSPRRRGRPPGSGSKSPVAPPPSPPPPPPAAPDAAPVPPVAPPPAADEQPAEGADAVAGTLNP
jgi:hypothetical protein